MTALVRLQRHRVICHDGKPHRLSRIRRQAARYIDRDHRRTRCIHHLYDLGLHAADLSGKPRTDQRIHDDIRAFQRRLPVRILTDKDDLHPHFFNDPAIQTCRFTHMRLIAAQEHRDACAQRAQIPGDDEAVSAIVARPADHHHRLSLPIDLRLNERYHIASCILHQHRFGKSVALHRFPIERTRLISRRDVLHDDLLP